MKMVRLRKSHLVRMAKVKTTITKNKLFFAIAIIIILVLVIKPISLLNKDTKNAPNPSVSEEIELEGNPSWRFYWIDLWILAIGGGFCSIMIIKQRKKGRDSI